MSAPATSSRTLAIVKPDAFGAGRAGAILAHLEEAGFRPLAARVVHLTRPAAEAFLDEAVTWSFLPQADADHFAGGNGGLWVLENPISEDMKAMRPVAGCSCKGSLRSVPRQYSRTAKVHW